MKAILHIDDVESLSVPHYLCKKEKKKPENLQV